MSNRLKFATRLALGLTLLTAGTLAPRRAQAAPITWSASYQAAQAKAKATGRPVMVDFYTDWCGWCKRLDSDIYPAPAVTQAAQKWVSVRVNAEKEGAALARRYGVTSFPTILFLDSSGRVLNRIDGYLPAPDFAHQMQNALAQLPLRAQLATRFNANPADLATATHYTQLCARQRDMPGALRGLARVQKIDPTGARGSLGACTNQVALLYSEQGDEAHALPLFQTAIKVSRRSPDVVLGYAGIADCYLAQRNKKAALGTLRTLLRDPKLDDQGRAAAQSMIARVQ